MSPVAKLERIKDLVLQQRNIELELIELINGKPDIMQEPAPRQRKQNPYSITQLVYDVLSDGKPRKVAQIAREIKEKTGFTVETSSVRGAAKYMTKQGKVMVDENTKEFILVEAKQPVAPTAPIVPPVVQ